MLNARIRKAFAATGATGSGEDSETAALDGDASAAGRFMLDVEFSAPPGVTILFGASGAGKTQTLKAIAGLARPDEGLVAVGGQTLFDSSRGVDVPVSRRRVGYVFQNLALFPHMSALENVEFAVGRLERRERRAKAMALLERFKVGHAARRRPRAVSGGEAQRVALARALASEPRLLLLDEPLSALDEATKLDIIADLKETNRALRLPILYVTHSREEALSLGERALVFERGRVVAEGEPHEVFGAPVKASVARLTGIENIFEGEVLSRSEEAGTMTVELRGGRGGVRFEQGGIRDEQSGVPYEQGGACRVEVPLGRARGRASLR
nr:ATP-binding cassette domain-containing protein [Acidobacteriota bacterium]